MPQNKIAYFYYRSRDNQWRITSNKKSLLYETE